MILCPLELHTNAGKHLHYRMGTAESHPEPLTEHLGAQRTRSALGAKVKAIPGWWSWAPPLLDLI